MTCQQVRSQLSEYFSDELPPQVRQAMAAHLQSCPACQQEWGKFCEAMAALRSLTAPAPPADLPHRIHAALVTRRRSAFRAIGLSVTGHPHRRWLWAGMAVASVAILLIALLPLRLPVRTGSEVTLMPEAKRSPFLAQQPSPPALSVPKGALKEEASPPPLKPSPESERQSTPKMKTPERARPRSITMRPPSAPLKDIAPQQAPLAPLPQTPSPMPRQAPLPAETPKPFPALATPSAPAGAGLGIVGEPSPIQTQSPLMRRIPKQAGGAQQALRALEAGIRMSWEHFEPPNLHEVALWRLIATPPIPCHLTLAVQPEEGVEVPNAAPQKTPDGGWLLGEGNATPQKPLTFPMLVRPKQSGILRLTLIASWDGQSHRWSILFAVSDRPAQPDPNAPVAVEQDRWTLRDLLTYLARQMQTAFLVPEETLEQIVLIPTGQRTGREILGAVEKWLGRRWQQVGAAFALTTSKGEE